MDGWIEVFRAGKQTDSAGRTREWTEADLDHTVASYKPEEHEAPVVVGHPKDNGPAFGWVESLKRDGSTLLAKFKQVVPAFQEAVQQGLYKKRSVSLFSDGRLRHVGFLGAAAPAVQGLKDIAFSEDADSVTIEFNEKEDKDMNEVEELKTQLAAKEAEAAEFKAKADAATLELETSRKEHRAKEVNDFIAAGIEKGTILPAWVEQGLSQFMLALDDAPQEYQFSEGTDKITPAIWFRNFISGLAAHPLFKTMTPPDKKDDAADYSDNAKAADLIASFSHTQKGA